MSNRFMRVCALSMITGMTLPAWAQVTIPDEYGKNIAHHSEVGTLTDGFTGDHIDLSSGRLEIFQTDIDVPGNNALPVRVARRFQAADAYAGGHFRYWSLDIPNVHGTFPGVPDGWQVEESLQYSDNRCSSFGPAPGIDYQGGWWEPDEYWHGTFFSLPGGGDQELLQILGNPHVPGDGNAYHAITKEGAAARCVALAPTSEADNQGEGFEVVTPDGVIYTLNQMVTRQQAALKRATSFAAPGFAANYILPRKDYILFPTKVTDRFGNIVTYVWSTINPWQLLHIVASDGRHLDFTYMSADSELVSSVSDGTRTWQYAYSASTGPNDDPDMLTLPDGTTWSYRLARLVYMTVSPNQVDCTGTNGTTARATWDSGTGTTYAGSITGPSGATATFTLARVLLGRSHVAYNCVSEDGDPTHARPNDPYLFLTAAVVGKALTGPSLPSAGLAWNYSYGPSNNCWDGTYSQGVACTGTSPASRQVLVTAPDGTLTRYTFGNRTKVDEGMLYKTEYGWNGTSALRTTQIEYADPTAAPYASYGGWSPRGRGDYAITSLKRPQRKVVTTQQSRTFTWLVTSDCSGMPYCFDTFARPIKVVKSSSP